MKSSKKISINQTEAGSLVTTSSFNEFTSSYTQQDPIYESISSDWEIIN